MQEKIIALDEDEGYELVLTAPDKKNDSFVVGSVLSVDFVVLSVNDKTNTYMEGYLKWDGCMNFDGGDNIKMHICGPEDVARISKYLNTIYVEAHDMFDNVDYDLP